MPVRRTQALQTLYEIMRKKRSIPLSTLARFLKGPFELLFLWLLVFPLFVFVSLPGLSTIFGILIVLNGLRIAQHKSIYLPKRFGKIKIPSKHVRRGLRWVEKRLLVKHTRHGVSKHTLSLIGGSLIFLAGIPITLPLPPGTNVPVAFAVLLIIIGLWRNSIAWICAGAVVLTGFFCFLGYLFSLVAAKW